MSLWQRGLVVLAAFAAAGCGGDGDDGVATEPTVEDRPDATATCTNEASGYRVEYPDGWHVNEGGPAEPCSFFDPEPVDVPEATEFLDVAVIVSREPVPFEVVTGEDPSRTVLTSEETEIAGRRAVRLEIEATGQGLLDAGTRSYQVVVAVDGESLIVSTYDLGGLDYERNKQVAVEIADSLQLLG